jgi:hypothetical protein
VCCGRGQARYSVLHTHRYHTTTPPPNLTNPTNPKPIPTHPTITHQRHCLDPNPPPLPPHPLPNSTPPLRTTTTPTPPSTHPQPNPSPAKPPPYPQYPHPHTPTPPHLHHLPLPLPSPPTPYPHTHSLFSCVLGEPCAVHAAACRQALRCTCSLHTSMQQTADRMYMQRHPACCCTSHGHRTYYMHCASTNQHEI